MTELSSKYRPVGDIRHSIASEATTSRPVKNECLPRYVFRRPAPEELIQMYEMEPPLNSAVVLTTT